MSEMIYLKNIPPASAVMWHQAQTTWSHAKDGHWGRCQILKGWCECHVPQCPPKNRTGVQQVDIKTSIRFLEQKSRLFKGSICQVLRAQGWCSTGCPVTHIEAPGAGAGGGPGWGRRQTVPSPYLSHPVLGPALVPGGGYTDSVPALRLLI